MALLLLHRHATVTICHSRTPDLPRGRGGGGHPRRGDRPAALRDAATSSSRARRSSTSGSTPVTDRGDGRAAVRAPARSGARRSSGAARSSSATCIRTSREVAGALSPVPGGVGPLTIAMLLKNTLTAAIDRAGAPARPWASGSAPRGAVPNAAAALGCRRGPSASERMSAEGQDRQQEACGRRGRKVAARRVARRG